MGVLLELSRSYFEVGKMLFEKKSKYQELNGVPAEIYLQKERSLFEELVLKSDID